MYNYLKDVEILCFQEYYEDFDDQEQRLIEPALVSLAEKGFLNRKGDCFSYVEK